MNDPNPVEPLEKVIDNALSGISEQTLMELAGRPTADAVHTVEQLAIDFTESFAVGICIGIRPDRSRELFYSNYPQHTLTTLFLYQYLLREFREQNIGIGIDLGSKMLHFIGIFPKNHEKDFLPLYIKPILERFEARFQIELCTGIGILSSTAAQLKNTYKTAEFAFNLYFFDPRSVLELQKINQFFNATLDDYELFVEDAVKAILVKAPDVLDKIKRVIDMIGRIHYGNAKAVRMRTMDFTGELAYKLRRYHLLECDFFEMQNELQEKVTNATTMQELKFHIHQHYRQLIAEIYQNTHPDSKFMIELVKKYIRENYMEELSIKELAEIACVSTNYFSHMFKNETGINYKAYLTNIRLEKAVELLMESDCKLTEISERIGYRNTRTFVDAFKKKYHVSPVYYRKNMKNSREQM